MRRLLILVTAIAAASVQRRSAAHRGLNDSELLPERRKCSSDSCFVALLLSFHSHWPSMERFCHQRKRLSSSEEAMELSPLADGEFKEYFAYRCPLTAAPEGSRHNTLASGCECVAQGRVCAAEDCRAAMEAKLGGPNAMSDFCFTGTLDDKYLLTPGNNLNKSFTFPMSLLMRDGGRACLNFHEVRLACACSLPKHRKWQFPGCHNDLCYASIDMLLGEATGRVCRDMLAGLAHAIDGFGIEGLGFDRRCDFAKQLKACRCTQPEHYRLEHHSEVRPCRQARCYLSLEWVLGSHVMDFCKAVLDQHASWDSGYSWSSRTTVDRHINSVESFPVIFKDAASLGCSHDELIAACRCAQPPRCAEESCYEETVAGSWSSKYGETLPRRGIAAIEASGGSPIID
ncbi:hypothetical protein CP533_6120 [Ophiocordyceps camponoti-saundersi (nom. inval.)]|nr:hypothetical protein CP533_6120 [Ophiocordyceps camponoti-saundersi (nom. inval.)]